MFPEVALSALFGIVVSFESDAVGTEPISSDVVEPGGVTSEECVGPFGVDGFLPGPGVGSSVPGPGTGGVYAITVSVPFTWVIS